jgi:protein-S-isoprenylcysteine O-methyltransferase Ste14
MDRATAIRAMALYVPIVVAFVLAYLRPGGRRLLAACLVGIAWVLPSLLAVQLLNLRLDWWQFHAQGGLLRDMPLDLLFGWAVLWGAIPLLAFRDVRIFSVVGIFVAIDLVLMPACRPVVELGSRWLIGEMVALALVLIPAQLFARWTLNDTRLYARAVMQVLTSGGVFLFLIPEFIFALRHGHGWGALLSQTAWVRNLELQGIALLGVLGVSAAQEFAERGGGTPIPYDPPKRLVTTGFYRYIANPMQLSCALVMTAWGGVLRNPWVAIGGAMSFVYGMGIAGWDEGEDLKTRFGAPWLRYRRHVRAWRFRLTPWHDPDASPARLYVAETCGPCSEVRRWFESRHAIALQIVAAEDHPTRDLQRITYDPMDGGESDEGVRAIARGLEHINLGWAFAGACLRLPVISHFVQLLMDVSGFGPRVIARRAIGQTASDSENQEISVCAPVRR